jgi:hypothetical protein
LTFQILLWNLEIMCKKLQKHLINNKVPEKTIITTSVAEYSPAIRSIYLQIYGPRMFDFFGKSTEFLLFSFLFDPKTSSSSMISPQFFYVFDCDLRKYSPISPTLRKYARNTWEINYYHLI